MYGQCVPFLRDRSTFEVDFLCESVRGFVAVEMKTSAVGKAISPRLDAARESLGDGSPVTASTGGREVEIYSEMARTPP